MVLVGIMILTGILGFVVWKNKSIPLLEVLAIGLFVSTLNQNVLDILVSNLSLFKPTKTLQMFWTSVMNRAFFIPLLVVLFIQIYSVCRTLLKKSA